MFCKHSENDPVEVLPGIRMRTTVHGNSTLMTEFVMKKGSILPEHDHVYEQTGYLISGCIRLCIGDEEFKVNAGDSWNIPGNVPHSARIIEDSVAIEIFSPCRDEYIQKK